MRRDVRLMKMKQKRYMILGIIGGIIVFGGNVLGVMWYNLWWAWGRTPMPPLTWFVLPRQVVGYHTIRFEIIGWSTCVLALIAWLIWKGLKSRTPA